MESGSKRERPLKRDQGMKHGNWMYLTGMVAALETPSFLLVHGIELRPILTFSFQPAVPSAISHSFF